jgi:hypothetical protein
MTIPNPTTTIEYRELSWAPGYCVGADGSVWTRKNSRWGLSSQWKKLRPHVSAKGRYGRVILMIDKTQTGCLVHRLILEAFRGPCPKGMEACHNDGDSTNNVINNLRWDTTKNNHLDKQRHGTSYQGERNHFAKLTVKQVKKIRRVHAAGKTSSRKLAQQFNISDSSIRHIIKRDSWNHVAD